MLNKFYIFALSVILCGCGKSEIDKCVDAKLISMLFKICESGELKVKCEEVEKIAIRDNIKKAKEGEYREECLEAASK